MILELSGVKTFIGESLVLHNVSLQVPEKLVTVILGRNGAGKTTTLRSIMGLSPPAQGSIVFKGHKLNGLPPYVIARLGIGFVPEDQAVFTDLTVEENLRLAMLKNNGETRERVSFVFDTFPDLQKQVRQKAGTLSGGQKQMLAIGRALVNDNGLVLVDEPSKGLAPIMIEKLARALNEIKKYTTIVLVEQNFSLAQVLGERYIIIDNGQSIREGRMAELREDQELRRSFLGISGGDKVV